MLWVLVVWCLLLTAAVVYLALMVRRLQRRPERKVIHFP